MCSVEDQRDVWYESVDFIQPVECQDLAIVLFAKTSFTQCESLTRRSLLTGKLTNHIARWLLGLSGHIRRVRCQKTAPETARLSRR